MLAVDKSGESPRLTGHAPRVPTFTGTTAIFIALSLVSFLSLFIFKFNFTFCVPLPCFAGFLPASFHAER